MNTPEGILIEDGELTIHVRKASKVRSIKLKLSHNEVFFSRSQIGKVIS